MCLMLLLPIDTVRRGCEFGLRFFSISVVEVSKDTPVAVCGCTGEMKRGTNDLLVVYKYMVGNSSQRSGYPIRVSYPRCSWLQR